MIGEAIHEDTLKALISQHVGSEVVVGRVAGDDQQWTLSVRSRREPLRIWKSLQAVAKYADAVACACLP
jgi:hypothetical protein